MSQGSENDEKSSRENNHDITVKKANIAADESPVVVLWGNFGGNRTDYCGALYAEIKPDKNSLKEFSLALFEDNDLPDNFIPRNDPLQFQRSVKKKEGPNGEVLDSDFNSAKGNLKNYLSNISNQESLDEYVNSEDEAGIKTWLQDLITSDILKGEVFFNFNVQLFSRTTLARSLSKKKSTSKQKKEAGEKEDEDEKFYHELTICSLPVHGISPDELDPGELIYVRVTGNKVKEFSASLQSARHEDATVPLEASVKKVKPSPELPQNYDGDPGDYYKIVAQFLGDKVGFGFVYKESKVKPLKLSDKAAKPDVLVPVLVGAGVFLGLLGGLAYIIFLL